MILEKRAEMWVSYISAHSSHSAAIPDFAQPNNHLRRSSSCAMRCTPEIWMLASIL